MRLEFSEQKRVPLEDAKRIALDYLKAQNRAMPASWVANQIWPDHSMKAQGAGAAASRILKRLEREKKVSWGTDRHGNHGWKVPGV